MMILYCSTMFDKFETICNYEGIKFQTENQHVHCLAHIINLAAQNFLKSLKEEAHNNENEIILEKNHSINTTGITALFNITFHITLRLKSNYK
jgi:hypothetical protein